MGKTNMWNAFKKLPGLLGALGIVVVSLMSPALTGHVLATKCVNSAGYGTATFTGASANVPAAGTYYIWSRLYIPTAGQGYQLEVNGNTCFAFTSSTAKSWVWTSGNGTKSAYTFNTTTGNSFKLFGLNTNVRVDRLVITSDSNCNPSGQGGNCGTTIVNPVSSGATPPVSTSSPGNIAGSTPLSYDGDEKPYWEDMTIYTEWGTLQPVEEGPVDGVTNPSETLATVPVTAIDKVEYYVDGKKLYSSKIVKPLDTTLLTNGHHKVETKITFKDGSKKSDFSEIDVNNKQTFISPIIRWMRLNKRPLAFVSGLLAGGVVVGLVFLIAKHLYLQRRLTHFHGF